MRTKIISLGLTALTAGTLAFTAATPAASANVVTDVCAALPGLQATATGNLAGAEAHAGVTSADLTTKLNDLNAATGGYVSALVAHLQALAAGTSTTVTQAVLNGAQTDLANKFLAWANADAADYTARQTMQAAIMQSNILNDLFNQLCSPSD